MLYQNMISAIGDTPLVRLKLDAQAVGAVYGKLELLNPFGMKDRVAKRAIVEARRTGVLREGAPIVESSSGTMALGVALVGTYLGHPVHIVTDPRIDPMTMAKLQSLGCTVHIVERMSAQGWQGARLARLHELMQHYPDAFWPHQYENPDNPRAYTDLAYELLDDLQRIDILVGAVGSGGSLCGTAQALHQLQHHVRVVGVDAVGSVIFGQPDRPGRLQGGLGNSLIPPNVDHHIVDEVHWLSDAEAFTATLELARDEKIFAGNSSGSVYAVARWISRHVQPDTQIVAIFPDRGDRYFSTIYNADYRATKGITVAPLPAAPQRVDYGTTVETWSYAFNEWSMPMIERHSHAKRALVH
jgi:S-sulfo-L-cysteine synthase (3-phospho-L-serine-dependent)